MMCLLPITGMAQEENLDFKEVKAKAETGDARSAYLIGKAYDDGPGETFKQGTYDEDIESDYDEAAKWYKIAADKNDADAQFALAEILYNGMGEEFSHSKAVALYEKAARQGHVKAMAEYGRCCIAGDGLDAARPKDAILYLTKSAEAGCSESYYFLGTSVYTQGVGTAADTKKAAECYLKGAEAGNTSCMYALGMAYLKGEGVTKSVENAKKWLQKGSDKGNVDCDNELKKL